MIFVIVESDPIVRIDLEETVRAHFPEATVTAVASLQDVDTVTADILITDSALDRKGLTAWLAQGAQIISTGEKLPTPRGGPTDGVVHLTRPFSSETVLQAIERSVDDT